MRTATGSSTWLKPSYLCSTATISLILPAYASFGRSRTPTGSIPQQFVDRGFRARLLVDAFDDHRAIEAWSRCAGLRCLAGQRARNDNRISGHFALERFAGLAIAGPGGGAGEDPH